MSKPKNMKKACQYKLLYAISNIIEVYEEPVPWTKKIPDHVVKFEAGEEDRNVNECLYLSHKWFNGFKIYIQDCVMPDIRPRNI